MEIRRDFSAGGVSPLRGEITEQVAPGKELLRGRKIKVLEVEAFSFRPEVSLYVQEGFFRDKNCVAIRVGDLTPVIVKVQDLAARFLLAESDIKEAARAGRLEKLIASQAELLRTAEALGKTRELETHQTHKDQQAFILREIPKFSEKYFLSQEQVFKLIAEEKETELATHKQLVDEVRRLGFSEKEIEQEAKNDNLNSLITAHKELQRKAKVLGITDKFKGLRTPQQRQILIFRELKSSSTKYLLSEEQVIEFTADKLAAHKQLVDKARNQNFSDGEIKQAIKNKQLTNLVATREEFQRTAEALGKAEEFKKQATPQDQARFINAELQAFSQQYFLPVEKILKLVAEKNETELAKHKQFVAKAKRLGFLEEEIQQAAKNDKLKDWPSSKAELRATARLLGVVGKFEKLTTLQDQQRFIDRELHAFGKQYFLPLERILDLVEAGERANFIKHKQRVEQAKFLGFPEENIATLLKGDEDALEKAVSDAMNKRLDEIVTKYEKALTESSTKLTKKTLLTIIQQAITTIVETPDTTTHLIEVSIPGSKWLGRKERLEILVGREKSGTPLKIVYLTKEKIGEGGFGTVEKVVDVTTGKIRAHKTPKDEKNALQEHIQEVNILRKIHGREKRVTGIQKTPEHVYVLAGKTGAIGKKYDGDLATHLGNSDFFTRSAKEKLLDCRQLLHGLNYLHKQNIKHGDIKPANVLVKKKKDGSYRVDMIDFGGARSLDELNLQSLQDNNDTFAGGYTLHYVAPNDFGLLKEALSNALKTGNRSDYNKIQKARDIFAMGIVLYNLFTNGEPDIANLNDVRERLREVPELPSDVQQMIVNMLNPNRNKRPSAEEAFAIIEKHIGKPS